MNQKSYKKYSQYSDTDFANDAFFQDWILCTNDENNRFWEAFLKDYPSKKQEVDDAKALLKSIRFQQSWPKDDWIDEGLQQAMQHIGQRRLLTPTFAKNKRSVGKSMWWAAACILGIMAIAGIYKLTKTDQKQTIVKVEDDIRPGTDKAILTLANGKHVVLDSTSRGILSKQGGLQIINLQAGKIAFQSRGASILQPNSFNTIATPKGGTYQIVLSDGTKVWLNAASSLKFPTTFSDSNRMVSLSGEGYFEVAHNAAKPFIVKTNQLNVKVLGTHFNISAYNDDSFVKTTLFEGKVNVSTANQQLLLSPGQQAQLQKTAQQLSLNKHVNLDQILAWKNGLFQFDQAGLATILKQAARWYDVEIHFEKPAHGTFSGVLPRSANIYKLLKILEATGKVKFDIQGKEITVHPL